MAYNIYTVIICKRCMKKKEYMICLSVLVLMYAWLIPGCGRQEGTFYTAGGDARSALQAEAREELCGETGISGAAEISDGTGISDGAGISDRTGISDGAEILDGTANNCAAQGADICFVHICGAVSEPGVYQVAEGSRLYEVILMAGGLKADACDYTVNQAQTVTDGMQVYIPTLQEMQGGTYSAAGGNGRESAHSGFTAGQGGAQDGRVDLNSATKEQLMTLPGIGESRAAAIIAYREEHGGFSDTKELMNVSGIKQGVYEQLKDLIRV